LIKRVECSTFNCSNTFRLTYSDRSVLDEYHFCKSCRKKHSTKVLSIQAEHEKDIKDILIDAAETFETVGRISDYLGVSFVTIYNWLDKYFDMTFQEFKRMYICKSKNCHLVDIKRSSYSRSDYILKKIQDKNYCVCINTLEPGVIMTNAPVGEIELVLRGCPKIEKISDNKFAIVPNPVLDIGLVKPYRINKVRDEKDSNDS
jgi:hypothetical protein